MILDNNRPITTVVNIRNERYDIYIGRKNPRLAHENSLFGNPFNNEKTRELSITKFKEYFFDRLENDLAFKQQVHKLRGKTLGCWCKPKKCHGDIIANYLNNLKDDEFIN